MILFVLLLLAEPASCQATNCPDRGAVAQALTANIAAVEMQLAQRPEAAGAAPPSLEKPKKVSDLKCSPASYTDGNVTPVTCNFVAHFKDRKQGYQAMFRRSSQV